MNDINIAERDLRLFADLYQHQQTDLAHLLDTTGHSLLFWEQGCGKGVLAARLGQAVGDEPKLYLTPASCKTQVARELVKWGGPDTRVQVLDGRRAKLKRDVQWVVVNYDLLLSRNIFEQLIAERWRPLIVDESHLLRNLSAQRTKLVLGSKSPCLADQADRVVCMSGTPIVNSPADLFPAINRLLPRAIAVKGENGELRRMQFAEYAARYCIFKTVRISGGRTVQVPYGAQNVQELRDNLQPFMSRRRRRDTLSLPALQLNEFALSVALTAELTATLKNLPKGLLDQLQAADGDELLALLRRHLQHLATLRRVIGVAKATAAADHIAERLAGGETRAIGFFHHHEVANVMAAQLQLAEVTAGIIRGDTPGVTRQQLIDAFDQGDLPVLLLQSQSGSLGLNLQSCRYAAIVEPDWTAAVTEQAIARLYRASQVRDVTIDFLLLPGSIDEHVVAVARRKAMIAAELIEIPIKETA